jgi:hypothetical protein
MGVTYALNAMKNLQRIDYMGDLDVNGEIY